jgi:hypothetical protein
MRDGCGDLEEEKCQQLGKPGEKYTEILYNFCKSSLSFKQFQNINFF